MPLVKLDMIRGVRSADEIRALADVVQECMVEHFAAPARDRYQVVTQHERGELIFEDTGLGLARSERLLLVHVFQQGRDAAQKQALYAALAEQLQRRCGLPPADLVVSVSRNEREDWSFGLGRAQFLTGEL